MRKFTPIPIIVMVIVSIVLASGVLFPDTPSLPRIPTGSGTIGGILSSLFTPDGSARNTNMLSGVYATGYLHNTDCSTEPFNKIWVGIDADGRGICGNVAKLIGILTEQGSSVTVSRDGGLTYTSVSTGTPLYEGDLIHSDASGTGMIKFAADNSLLRFAPNTDLELDYGTLGADTVAEVILNNGRLWGRILSATGVNLGGGGLVTGVRGTSVDIKKTLGGVYTINTVSSANTNNSMYSKMNGSGPALSYAIISGAMNYGSGILITYMSGAPGYTVTKNTQLTAISYGDSWIRKNTFLDINYLSNLLLNSGAITIAEATRINTELDNTLVQGNGDVTAALLEDADLPGGTNISDVAQLLDAETAGDNKNNARALNCKMLGKTYFPTIPSNTVSNYCNGSWNTLWTTMDMSSTGVLSAYGSHGDVYTTSGASTNIITNSGQYLLYALDGADLTTLTGKKIRIKLTQPAGTIESCYSNKCYVFDGGNTSTRFLIYKEKKCDGSTPNLGHDYLCKGTTFIADVTGSTEILLPMLPSAPTQFVVGNMYIPGNVSLHLKSWIGTNIKSVSIE